MTIVNSERRQKCVILCIDILGFKNFICSMTDEQEMTLNSFYKNWKVGSPVIETCNGVVGTEEAVVVSNGKIVKSGLSFFSDTLAMSWLIDNPEDAPSSVFIALSQAAAIQRDCLEHLGLLMRGAIHIGDLYHNHPILYGKGWIDAYQAQEDAKYPRVILTENVKNIVEQANYSIKIYKEDNDGVLFVDYLPNHEANSLMENYKSKILAFKMIDHAVKLKILWFQKYFNGRLLEFSSSVKPIKCFSSFDICLIKIKDSFQFFLNKWC